MNFGTVQNQNHKNKEVLTFERSTSKNKVKQSVADPGIWADQASRAH